MSLLLQTLQVDGVAASAFWQNCSFYTWEGSSGNSFNVHNHWAFWWRLSWRRL